AANANGVVTITVTAMDDGGTAHGGVDTFSRTFTITVNAVNDPPVFDPIADQTANEDSGTHNVSITRLGPGGGAADTGQTVTLPAPPRTPAVVPTPTVTGSGAPRTLPQTPAANANGVVTITVTAMDNGGTANGGVDTTTQTFTLTINAVNDHPVFDPI